MPHHYQEIYDSAFAENQNRFPLIDHTAYVTERGMSFESARKLLIAQIEQFEQKVKDEGKRTYVMPNHRAGKAVYAQRLKQYKEQSVVLDTLEEEEEKREAEILATKAAEPLAIIQEMEKPKRKKKPSVDYTRAIVLGGAVFTGLMLLLIWRIGK